MATEKADMTTSYFANDFIDRVVGKLLGRRRDNPIIIVFLCLLVFWLPVQLLSMLDIRLGHGSDLPFINDYAAVAQYLVGIPAFLIARKIIDNAWMEVQETILVSQIVGENKRETYGRRNLQLNRLVNSRLITILIIILGFTLPLLQLLPLITNGQSSWLSYVQSGSAVEKLTFAGWYTSLISIPVTVMLGVYWFGKYVLWILFLFSFSQSDLELDGFHPDRTGGLLFLSQLTVSFGVLIFTIGIIVLATVVYKINIEGYLIQDPEILMLFFSYMLIAPLLFVLPLTFFTLPLYRAKISAIHELNKRGYLLSRVPEMHIKESEQSIQYDAKTWLEEKSALYDTFAHVKGMRVWPIDISTISRLFMSSIAPMLPLIARLIQFPKAIQDIIDKILS